MATKKPDFVVGDVVRVSRMPNSHNDLNYCGKIGIISAVYNCECRVDFFHSKFRVFMSF